MLKKKTNWDCRFIELAIHIGKWSKDPSQGVGAVIVDDNRRVLSIGFNGFPRGVKDSDVRLNDKETKLQLVVHAETNAILFADRDLRGSTLYVSLPPCSKCAGLIIQSGIKRVVYFDSEDVSDRWKHSFDLSMTMFKEAGVKVKSITGLELLNAKYDGNN